MREGSWTIENCDYAEVKALAEALEVSEITASVLVRRGYRDVEAARAFVAGEIEPHDPFLLGDMADAVERIRAAIAGGKRICVHGDYDVDGICATALAVLTLRELGAEVELAPAEPLRGGLRRLRRHDLAARRRGLRAAPHRRLRDHRGRGGRGREGARARGDRHRPPPSRRDAARLPDRGDAAVRLPVPGALRHRRRLQARAGARRRRRRRTSTSSRSRRSPTSCRCSTRTARSRSPACAPSRGRSGPGLQALMRNARVDPAAVDAAAVGFRLAPRINAAGRLGRPDAALELLLTDRRGRGEAARRRARDAEPRPAGGRGPDPAARRSPRSSRGRRRSGAGAAT